MRNIAARSNLLVPEVREVMDIRQASDYLGVSPDTLYKYASEGFVPAFKLGNRWRFKRSRLERMDGPSVRSPVRHPGTGPAGQKASSPRNLSRLVRLPSGVLCGFDFTPDI